jgi:hypothetical protein
VTLTSVTRLARRFFRLHGDALDNAAQAVHRNDKARRHRERVQADVDAIVDRSQVSATPDEGTADAPGDAVRENRPTVLP